MYAVLKCGGKQLKVSKGDTVLVEKLAGEKGEKVTLDNVLLLADGDKLTVGTPVVEGATVTASIVEQIRDKKVIIFKKKRRQGYKRKKGHRQYLTVLKVEEISAKPKAKKAAKA
ncbi:MAG: 50S ribosomal protein L21 [Magnetococcales bacterium]|nr:50S ribosomal protein L21 [Magnetococcales bacterium]MEC8067581.1 50S ribosomal protein L21 [Pseudomonadota bacterium]|tara:strand:- start:135 stop:476 length:342 start_codon:yes stop_codon:yes gene_type:complete